MDTYIIILGEHIRSPLYEDVLILLIRDIILHNVINDSQAYDTLVKLAMFIV